MLVKYKETQVKYSLIRKPSSLKIRKVAEEDKLFKGWNHKDIPDRWKQFSEAQKHDHNLLYEEWVRL